MASWNEGAGSPNNGDDKDSFIKLSPSQKVLTPSPPKEICPDSEENVQEQTEGVFRNFVYQRYRNDNIQHSYDSTPVEPEIVSLPRVPDSFEAEIGRQLARVGDGINEKYKDTFDTMINSLNIRPDVDSAYDVFAGIARKMFADGINWGRILMLFCFAYRIAIKVLRDHSHKFTGFLRRIGQLLLKFLISERISKWIADNGGWRAALTFKPAIDTRTLVSILSLAAVSVIAVVVWNRYSV